MRSEKQPEEKFDAKLLVEGKDDQNVIWAICKKYRVPKTLNVIDCGGISQILERLPLDLKEQGIKTIGIVVDADQDLQQIWKSLHDRLAPYGYRLPAEPNPQGFTDLPHDMFPSIGIWIMPDNETGAGMLEHFVERLIPDGDSLHPKALQILSEIQHEGLNRYPMGHHKKALIHTWLAWQERPGTPMGSALTKTYLDHNADLCLRFVSWLNLLFNVQ